MDDPIPPPPVAPPPVDPFFSHGQAPPTHEQDPFHGQAAGTSRPGGNWQKKAGPAGGLAVLGAKALSLLKFAKFGKILLTSGSMLVSIWAYAQWFGVPFAIGFVILIFVHEMGHVFAAWKMGIPVSAPIFIPFMGALILTKKFGNKLITHDAIIGIGGPAFGTAGALVCALIYMKTGSAFFLGLAYITFFLNLFNLTPIYPLDGGWIVRAISPILWIVGMAVMGYMIFTGQIRNPMIFILIILGLPTMYTELKGMIKRIPSPVPAAFRWQMGAAYVALMVICGVGMSECQKETDILRARSSNASGPAVALR